MLNLKEDAKRIFLSTLQAIDITRVIHQRVKLKDDHLEVDDERIKLSGFKEIVIVGFGKASLKMGAAIEAILENRIARGILVSPQSASDKTVSEVVVAGHPLPDDNSLLAGKKIIQIVESCSSDSLIIFLISGGGSALVELPLWDDVTLEDLQQLNKSLIHCGANIREINTVRKHLSQIKGGRLGYLARGSKSLSLYVSDVNSGDLKAIASNPLMPDDITLDDFFSVITKYSLADKLPESIKRNIKAGRLQGLPGRWEDGASDSISVLLLENKDALAAAASYAEGLGYVADVDSEMVEGDYKQIADQLIEKLLDLRMKKRGKPVCLISGGEASCKVTGNGIGGRNQEFVLYSATRLLDLGLGSDVAVLSCGTDGIDGNSTAAGAVADAHSISIPAERGVEVSDYFKRNDSHSFFKQFGGLIMTGGTGNNVRDLRVLLARPLK